MMTITTALSYAAAYGSTFEDFLIKSHELGFNEVQLIPDQEPNLYSELVGARLSGLIKLKSDLGMKIHLHNVFYDINPLSLVPDVRIAALEITRRVLSLARSLDSESLTVHPGYMFGGWRRDPIQRERFWRNAASALEDLALLSEEFDVPILLENGSYYICTANGPGRTPLHLGITPEEVRQLVDLSTGRLGITLDVNKALRSGRPLIDFLDLSGKHIGQLQISTAPKYESEIREVIYGLRRYRDSICVVLEGDLHEAKQAAELLGVLARTKNP